MKILVVERDDDLRDLISTRLRARNFEVFEAQNSLNALKLLDRDRMDVILISDQMERIGTQIPIEAIRRRPHLTSVPVILITKEESLSELVMSRERGYDDFLTVPFNPFVLHLRVVLSVERSRHRAEANALTHLPGNHAIEKMIRKKIEKKEKFSVLYIDINHFKSFNDYYSFEKGDDVIRQTARILMTTAESICRKGEYFLGHIGGDDFIVVLNPDEEERFSKTFLTSFDQIIPTYYTEEDRLRGAIRVKNRRGKMENFPLMSCSVAACTNLTRHYNSLGEIARDAMEVKAFLKSQPGSRYLRDRRVEPVQTVADTALPVALPIPEENPKGEDELMPLGQLLLKAKLITGDQLATALKQHLQTGQRLGQILTGMKVVRTDDVGKILERKLKVPYFPLQHFVPHQELMDLLPRDFVRIHRVVPLQKMDHRLKLGMCDPLDRQTLEQVKAMTQLKPIPYLVMEDELEDLFHRDTQLNLFQERA